MPPTSLYQIIANWSHFLSLNDTGFFFRPIMPMVLDANYISLKNQVIKAERRVLKELGFCVHVKHPHKVSFVKVDF